MIGLVGLNWFNQNNTVGRDLWAITLAEGGGNPGMKHNPIYVREQDNNESVSVTEEEAISEDADSLNE